MNEQCRILAVDDDPMNIAVLEDLLEDYHICTATDGPEALAKAQTCQPDLILLDIMMPGMSGYEVCERLRRDERFRATKIILVSAKAGVEERLKGYAVGADDYVIKPFDCEELLAKIKVYLRLSSMEEVDRLKSSMLRLLRHEVRTPMAGMISGLEILADACPEDPQERTAMIGLVLKNVHRLHHLIERVVELSVLEAGEQSFEREPVALRALAQAVVESQTAQAAERQVVLTITGDEALQVDVDVQMVGRVIGDLLDNAIRFSPDGETVEVRVEESAGRATLAIRDCGPGIARTSLAYLFTGFSDPDVRHHSKGTGLSLAIAQRVVQQHGGRIRVDSEPDKGSCFRIVLPLACDANDPAEPTEMLASASA